MDRWSKAGVIGTWVAVVLAAAAVWETWPKSDAAQGAASMSIWAVPSALIAALVLSATLHLVAAIVSRGKKDKDRRPFIQNEVAGQTENDRTLIQSQATVGKLEQELRRLQARDDEFKRLYDVIKEQAHNLSSLIQMEQALIASHNLLTESPYIELRFLVKNCSVFDVSIPELSGHLCFGNQQLEIAPTFAGKPMLDLKFWHHGGFDLRQQLKRHEALTILNSDRTSFGFHRIEFPIVVKETNEQHNLYMNCEVTNDALIDAYPKLEITILASALREYNDLSEDRRFNSPEHLGSVVNINLEFENPRSDAIKIRQYKLITHSDVARTTSAQPREIREKPALGVSGEAQGLALPNLNDRPIRAEQREPFDGWLQFLIKVTPESIHGTVAELVIVDTSGEEHRAKTRTLQFTKD